MSSSVMVASVITTLKQGWIFKIRKNSKKGRLMLILKLQVKRKSLKQRSSARNRIRSKVPKRNRRVKRKTKPL